MALRRSSLLIFALGLFSLFLTCDRNPSHRPRASQGSIDFSGYSFSDSGPVELRGEWIFVWNELPDVGSLPDFLRHFARDSDQTPGTVTYMELPGRWNGQSTGESRASATGFATYLLRFEGLSSSDMERLAFRMKDALTAYKVYIVEDGQEHGPVMSNGVVGTSVESSVPQHLPLVSPLPSELSSGWIVWQISNFHDGIGGPIYPLILGTEKDLLKQRENKRSRDFLVLGVLLVMSLYHFALFAQRQEDRASLWFAIFNATITLRMLLTEKYIQGWFPEPDEQAFEWMMKFDYGTAFIAVPVFFAFLQSVFFWRPSVYLQKPVWIVASLFLLSLSFPQRVYGPYSTYYFVWALFLCIWMMVAILLAVRNREMGASASFAGLLALLGGGINDALLADGLISSTYLLPYAFIFFVIAQSYILVRRFTHAYHTAEHLSEHLQREVAHQTSELEGQNQKLAEITRQRTLFFQNISHELRTPLTLIFGLLESVSQGEYGSISEQLKRPVASMQKNARQLLRLINQLLDLSRIEAGQVRLNLEAVNVSRLLQEMTDSYYETARRKSIDLKTSIAPDLFASADPEKLEKVFYNLMSNAMKFTPSHGEVNVDLYQDRDRLIISISDSGPGINDLDRERIFQRFFQVQGPRIQFQEGTGIGLSIVKEFVELHGGSLDLESNPDRGSKFTVSMQSLIPDSELKESSYRLSLYRGDQEFEYLEREVAEKSARDTGAEPEEPKATILVVEDSEDMRNFISHVLGAKYRIILAENGQQGLEMTRMHKPDLLLSDIMMPVLDGPAMIAEIKSDQSLKHIPCALLSARLDIENDTGTESDLADFFLAKPFQPVELREAVASFLNSIPDSGILNSRD